MKKVLHIVGAMNRAGLESRLMDVFRFIDKNKVEFGFTTCIKEKNDFSDEIAELGGNLHHAPSPKKLFSRFIFMYRLIKQEKYMVLHCHWPTAVMWPDMLAGILAGVKLRIYHSRSASNTKYRLVHKICRPINNFLVTHRLAVSRLAALWMFGKRQVEDGNVTILPNAIDVSKFIYDEDVRKDMRNRLNVADKFVVGHVGRLADPKNHEFAIEVFNEILKTENNAVLVLIGEGGKRPIIEKIINELGIQNNVFLLGAKDDVNTYYQAMDVFIFPSLFEGFPGSVLEAQTNGLPCIISDTITDEVVICENCVPLNLNESKSKWANAIMSAKRISNGHEVISEAGYDIKESIDKWMEIYTEK